MTRQGLVLGALCVMGPQVRDLDHDQRAMLVVLAGQVRGLLEVHKERQAGPAVATQSVQEEQQRLQQARQQLEAGESRMALVLKGANDGWWDWDLMTGERYYAPRGWDMLGYAEDEAPDDGRLWERLIHPEDAPRVQVIFDTAIQGRGSHYSAEFRLRHRGGHFVPVLSRGYILRDDQGRAIRLSGTNTDLSQRKEAEQSLRSEDAQPADHRRIPDSVSA